MVAFSTRLLLVNSIKLQFSLQAECTHSSLLLGVNPINLNTPPSFRFRANTFLLKGGNLFLKTSTHLLPLEPTLSC